MTNSQTHSYKPNGDLAKIDQYESLKAKLSFNDFQQLYFAKKYPEAMTALDDLLKYSMYTIDYPLSTVPPVCTWNVSKNSRQIVTELRSLASREENESYAKEILNKILTAQKKVFASNDLRIADTYKELARTNLRFGHPQEAQVQFDEFWRIRRSYYPFKTCVDETGSDFLILRKKYYNPEAMEETPRSERSVCFGSKTIKWPLPTPDELLKKAISNYENSISQAPFSEKNICLLSTLIARAASVKRADLITKYGLEREKLQVKLEKLTPALKWEQCYLLTILCWQAQNNAETKFWLNELKNISDYRPNERQLTNLCDLESKISP